MPLLVVCMLSLGPFAQGVDEGTGDLEQTVGNEFCIHRPLDNFNNSSYEAYPPVMFATWGSDIHLFYPNADRTGYDDRVVVECESATTSGAFDDLDRDGYLDLIVGRTGNVDSYIFWGNGDDNWSKVGASRIRPTTSNECLGVYTGNLNGDVWPDIICQCSNPTPGRVTNIFLNKGDGTFDRYPSINITFATSQQRGMEIDIGDLNNDGYEDIVNAGNCYFSGPDGPATQPNITFHSWPMMDVHVYDLDTDGNLDVMYTLTNHTAKIYLGGPDGPDTTVDYTLDLGTDHHPWPAAGDLNADGYVDLVVGGGGHIKVYKGSSQGWSDDRKYEITASSYNGDIKIIDITKDGYDDIIVGIVNQDFQVYYGGEDWPTAPNISKSGLGGCWAVIGIAIPRGGSINATMPSEPHNLTAKCGDRIVQLEWDAPNDTGGVNLVRYNIYRGFEVDNLSKIGEVGRTITTYTDRPPRTGVEYHYAVTAFNIKGESNRSVTVNVTNNGRPLEPVVRISAIGYETLSIAWDPPIDTGGFPILGYKLYRGDTSLNPLPYADLGNITVFRDEGLENGRTYYYQVMAFNKIGEGPRSKAVDGTPLGPPSAPRYLTATSKDAQIDIEWRPPQEDGGRSVIGYRIYRGSTEENLLVYQTVDHFETKFQDTGLKNGHTYHYAVLAFHEIGESPLSNIASGTPIGLPGVPIDFQIEAGDSEVTLTWDPPVNDGGTPILRYQVFRGTSKEQLITLDYTNQLTTIYNDKGLNNGQPFYYSVCAENAVGNGPLTEILEAIPLALPDAPGDLIAETGDGSITISWLRPVHDGGTEVTHYIIYRGMDDGSLERINTVAKARFTYTDEDLVGGTTYHYAVAALTLAGEGSLSIVASATPFGPPGPPISIEAILGDSEVRLSWSAPENDGASDIEGYVIFRGTSTADLTELVQLGDVTSYLDTSVTNGQTYYYTVAAINEAGPGDHTDPVSATPFKPATVPDKVTILTVEAKDSIVVVQWTEPQEDGGSPITGYVVLRGEAPGGLEAIATLGPVFTWTDEDVERGTTYHYSVAAINDVGEGEPFFAREVKVPKEKKDEGPGFEVIAVLAALLVLVPIVRRRWMR